MNAAPRWPEYERLRLLGIMDVDVYVPRARLARTSLTRRPRIGVRVAPADARAHARLLQGILRAAGMGTGDWLLELDRASGDAGWEFGSAPISDSPTPGRGGDIRSVAGDGSVAAAAGLKLPSLAELRESIPHRRAAWRAMRAWLRRQ